MSKNNKLCSFTATLSHLTYLLATSLRNPRNQEHGARTSGSHLPAPCVNIQNNERKEPLALIALSALALGAWARWKKEVIQGVIQTFIEHYSVQAMC